MTWGTTPLWSCACWKEATSSVPTWWTGSRTLATTPTAQSPWRCTSSVSRVTWWAVAHSSKESWQFILSGICVRSGSIFTLKSITCEFRVSHKRCIIFHALGHWYLPINLPWKCCFDLMWLLTFFFLAVKYCRWDTLTGHFIGYTFKLHRVKLLCGTDSTNCWTENYFLFLDDEGGTRCGLLLRQPICSRVQCDVHTDISELLLPFYEVKEVSPLTSGVNNASSHRELALTEYSVFFGQFSMNPGDGSVGKSK